MILKTILDLPKNNLDLSEPIWTGPNIFGPIEGQGIYVQKNNNLTFGSSSAASISLASRFFSSVSDDMIAASI